MQGEIILLVAGLTVVATLPIQEQVPSTSKGDLLKFILSAHPEENDLKTASDQKMYVESTKIAQQVIQTEDVEQHPLPHPQDLPHHYKNQPQPQGSLRPQTKDNPEDQPLPQAQDTPQVQLRPQALDTPQVQLRPHALDTPQVQPQPQAQDTPQVQLRPHALDTPQVQPQPQAQDTPQVQLRPQTLDTPQVQPQLQAQNTPQVQPQAQDTPQEQPQQQYPEIDPSEEPSLPYVSEDKAPKLNFHFNTAKVWPESQPVLIESREVNLPYDSESAEEYELHPELEMENFSDELDDAYEILQADEELPSLDPENIFVYRVRMAPFSIDQEGELLLSNPEEPQEEPVPYTPDVETHSYETNIDSLLYEPKEQPMKTLSVQSHDDILLYDSDELLDPGSQMDFSPVDEDNQESDYEQLPHEMEEGPFKSDDYDYGFPEEGSQPGWEYTPSVHDDISLEESYHKSQGDIAVDPFSWLVPNFFDEESNENDDSSYVTGYHDDMTPENPFVSNPNIQNADWEAPAVFEDGVDYDDSFSSYEEDAVLVRETGSPHQGGFIEGADGDVSLADFFIPTYESPSLTNVQQKYPDDGDPEDAREEPGFLDNKFFVDDGLFDVEPDVKSYKVDVEQDHQNTNMFGNNILSQENLSFEDEKVFSPWPAEGGEDDQIEYQEDTPVTLLENPPAYSADVGIDSTLPSLLEILNREIEGDELVQSWNGAKFLMRDLVPGSDAENDDTLHTERDYISNSLDNDAMDIILVKDSRKNFDSLSIMPLVDDRVDIQRYPVSTIQYIEDHRMRPYWELKRTADQQFPKMHLSITDELPNKNIPTLFDRMDEIVSYSLPPSHRSLTKSVMRSPFTLNEVMDDDLPPQYLASPITSPQFMFMGTDTLSSTRNYPDASKTPSLSFRDLLQRLNPLFYDDTHINNMAAQNYPPYPQSYSSMQHHNDLLQQLSHTFSSVPYSSPFNSFHGRDYSSVQNYTPQTFSFYPPRNKPGIFMEDTMPDMFSRQPRRTLDDYTINPPFNSFSKPRPRFPLLQRPQYSAHPPAYKRPPFFYNRLHGMGPYHPTPVYPKYAHEYQF